MSLIVKHKVTKHGFDEHWFLRGVSDDGKFYGDFRRHLTSHAAQNYIRATVDVWEGALSESDNAEFHSLANRLFEEFEFSAEDLSNANGVRTRIFRGQVGSPPNIQLAQVDGYGIAFPNGCGEVVGPLMSILERYTGPEYRKPIAT